MVDEQSSGGVTPRIFPCHQGISIGEKVLCMVSQDEESMMMTIMINIYLSLTEQPFLLLPHQLCLRKL
jgi:hypothetical protein